MVLWGSLTSGFSGPQAAKVEPTEAFFANHVIPRIRIQLDQDALAALRNHFRSYVPATVIEGTNTYRDVGIHLKGQYGTFQGIDGRPSLTLNFNKYIRGQRFHGMDKIHLNNSAQDPSYLCELIGRELFEAAGIPTARATHARAELNGRDLGLCVLTEGYDKRFLKRHFKNPDGNLYDSEFRHDITDPLKKGSGKGPDDHSDLMALAAAAEEPNPAQRLTRLSKLLDLDRFYSTLALESMMRHHDGYAISINNYWIYQDPTNSRAVFLPHGMDQLFYQPQAALLPDLEGVLALAVLQTQTGRREFRARCVTLYTKFFPTLSNRVEIGRAKIRPVLAQLGSNTVAHHDQAVTNLQRRIDERLRYLQREVLSTPSEPLFGEAGIATLTNWIAAVEDGSPNLTETNLHQILRVQFKGGDKSALARWQTRVLLSTGTYQISAKVSADQSVFRGPACPVSLRIWGMNEVQAEMIRSDPRVVEMRSAFEVAPANQGDYLIQCEAHGTETSVSYQFSSITLTRLQ